MDANRSNDDGGSRRRLTTRDSVVVAAEYEGLLETLDIVAMPGEREEIEAGRTELAAGLEVEGSEVLARYLDRET